MNKLINCGCGGKPYLDFAKSWDPEKEEWISNSWHRVICRKCGTQTIAFYTEAEAIQAWNTAMENCDKLSRVERTAKVENIEDPAGMGAYGDCSECGAEVTEQYAYCPNCGAKLEWE